MSSTYRTTEKIKQDIIYSVIQHSELWIQFQYSSSSLPKNAQREANKTKRKHIPTTLTYLLHRAEPSWEADWFSDSKEIPRVLWKPKVHYRIHKTSPPVLILSQLDPVHTPTFLKNHLTIILPFTPGPPKWALSFRFRHQNPTILMQFEPKKPIFSKLIIYFFLSLTMSSCLNPRVHLQEEGCIGSNEMVCFRCIGINILVGRRLCSILRSS